jgi:hypothetical protein
MRLERKLATGAALVVLAGGATGGALAATGGAPVAHRLPFSTSRGGLLRASADYLGVRFSTLRAELKAGKTLAQIANSTPGRSERSLLTLLVARASLRIEQIADRPLQRSQRQALRPWLRRRLAGFLDNTCPLSLVGIEQHLAGCAAARL